MLAYCIEKKLPAVICTTGYSPEQVAQIKEASKKIAIFYSGNMSLGINLLIELSKKAAKVFGESFDIEIIEKHHNQKLDAPSGTALMIADAITEYAKTMRNMFMTAMHTEKSVISVKSASTLFVVEILSANTKYFLQVQMSFSQ